MATRVKVSAVFPFPIESIWTKLREFTFPGTLLTSTGIESCVMLDGAAATCVGATRQIKWKTGETRTHRLLGLSDQFYTMSWELVEASHATEITGCVSQLSLYRITEHEQTLVEWQADFSADVKPELIKFEQKAYQQNLIEIRNSFAKK
eukprot:TRINITY_DN3237_c0_g1_i1.p4 TRINITY_DN3237_c0_g1~~TRINITY_DN3237_c0_g1_i1.p4  ORF type:complete len:149 (-),score=51.81 TRINITY_DN3237_c0_g1_i1:1063-1509(-)